LNVTARLDVKSLWLKVDVDTGLSRCQSWQ